MTLQSTHVPKVISALLLDRLLHQYHVRQAHSETQPVLVTNQSAGLVLQATSVWKGQFIHSLVTLATLVRQAHQNHLLVLQELTAQL